MALIDCSECGRQISDKARACPQCGAPLAAPAPRATTPPPASGLTYRAMVIIATALVLVVGALIWGNKPNPDPLAELGGQPHRAAPVDPAGNAAVRAAAIEQFRSAEPLMIGAWPHKDEFWITVADTRRNWQPAADGACVWIRGQGMQGRFSVSVVEMSAVLNKRIEQLAHANCG